MNRYDEPTDQMLEAAFARRAEGAVPDDLRGDVLTLTATAPQRRVWRLRLEGAISAPTLRPAWMALLIVVAILGVAVVAAGLLHRSPLGVGALAYVRNGAVYVADADGANSRVVLHEAGVTFSTVAWSPDGKTLAIDGSAGADILDVGTGTPRHIGGSSPAWSPDGRQVAVIWPLPPATTGPGDLRIVDPLSGAALRTYSFDTTYRPQGELTWSPNGRWIAATGGRNESSVVRIDVATGDAIEVDRPSGLLGAMREPAWSPDSQRIAFIRWGPPDRPVQCTPSPPSCSTNIVVADADGSHSVVVNRDSGLADQPRWSPNGQWLAFRDVARVTNNDLVVVSPIGVSIVHPDGTGEHPVTTLAVGSYAWSRAGDGLQVAMGANEPQPGVLMEISLAGQVMPLGARVDMLLDDPYTPLNVAGLPFDWQAPAP
jgi:dipeptidyl aminopeptidase/acylaminoacyl peptidase